MAEDIGDLLDSLNIDITGTSHSGSTGDLHYSARCPHHHCRTPKGKPHVKCSVTEDFNPSWDINAVTGAHHCHACGFGGSVEWLIHVMTGVSMSEAQAKSGKGARALTKVLKRDPWGGERPVALPPMNEARIKMYVRPPQWAMDKRHLDQDTVDTYDIRWADPFLHGQERTPYEHCWITAIRDPKTGAPWGMQVKQETGDRFFRNLPGTVPKSEALFGYDAMDAGGVIYVFESPLDAAYAWTLGFPSVSSMGAVVSGQQMELLIGKWDRIVLALDWDESGIKAMRRLIGLGMDGRYDFTALDYSKRVPIAVALPLRDGVKDLGEMDRLEARNYLGSAVPAFRLQMRSMEVR